VINKKNVQNVQKIPATFVKELQVVVLQAIAAIICGQKA
jgi:hypothetical protein